MLAAGIEMPLLGLGVWEMESGAETEDAVRWALEAGYRHLDTAQSYGNEESVGRGLRASGVDRDEVFVTTKFAPAAADPVAEAEASLRRLGVDRLDLYLVHWPEGGPLRAWRGMERAQERGLARSIGVSNFSKQELAAVIAEAEIPPAVNQVQFSPFQFRRRLLEACEQHRVALEAYSPLTRARDLNHPVITGLAADLGRTPAQVMLRWALERDLVVIPKSRRKERIAENSQIFDFRLSKEQMTVLDALDRTGGSERALEHNWWTYSGRAGRVAAALAGRLRRR